MKVTAKQAETVLEAVKQAFPAFVQELDADYNLVPTTDPEMLPKGYWEGHNFVIVWESGSPYDWACYFPYGGVEEEFGSTVKDVSSSLPKGVHVEPINGYSVALYRD